MRVAEFYIAFFLVLVVLIFGTLGIVFVFSQRPVLETNHSIFDAEVAEKEFTSQNPEILAEPETSSEINIVPRKELPQSPEIVKAIYLTSWSASRSGSINYLIDIARTTEINAVVIDIKDFSGYVAYNTAVPEAEKYGAEQIRIRNIRSLIDKLHGEGIYVIARITIFQDPILAQARPDLAVHSRAKLSSPDSSALSLSSLWLDDVGLAWIDPAAKEAWKYNIDIAKDAINSGFDEINFDYIRFPSDGDLEDMSFPVWDGNVPKHTVIREFFKYLDQELSTAKTSIDLFGLSTINSDDLGVGQVIEDAFRYSDFVCPMVYPSHYADGFLGYENSAEHPYEVVKYSMDGALRRLKLYRESQKVNAQLRPWLQDFDLGATYDAQMVRSQIEAVYDALGHDFYGFMLWNSWNYYTREALELK